MKNTNRSLNTEQDLPARKPLSENNGAESTQPSKGVSFLSFLPLGLRQIGKQRIERTPEPDSITDANANVLEYNRVLETSLSNPYSIALETISRLFPKDKSIRAIELASGPGQFTLLMTKTLHLHRATGIDLAPHMIEVASKNAVEHKLQEQVDFKLGNILKLKNIKDGTTDLSVFMDAAHHFPTINDVAKIFQEMDRITKPDGVVFISDLVRLRTKELTDTYLHLAAGDYFKRGLEHFFEDFKHSLFAAWTPGELRQAIPTDTKRIWVQIVPRFLPSMQVIIGLPVGRSQLWVSPGFTAEHRKTIVHPLYLSQYEMLRKAFFFGSIKRFYPKSPVELVPSPTESSE